MSRPRLMADVDLSGCAVVALERRRPFGLLIAAEAPLTDGRGSLTASRRLRGRPMT
jgi:hypothetical protein